MDVGYSQALGIKNFARAATKTFITSLDFPNIRGNVIRTESQSRVESNKYEDADPLSFLSAPRAPSRR